MLIGSEQSKIRHTLVDYSKNNKYADESFVNEISNSIIKNRNFFDMVRKINGYKIIN